MKKIHQKHSVKEMFDHCKKYYSILTKYEFFSLLTDCADNNMPSEHLYTVIWNNN